MFYHFFPWKDVWAVRSSECVDSPECGVRVLTTIQCLYTLTTRNGADKSASCTIKKSSRLQCSQGSDIFVGLLDFLMCSDLCADILGRKIFQTCSLVAKGSSWSGLRSFRGGKETCLLFLFIWVCKTEQWNIHMWPRFSWLYPRVVVTCKYYLLSLVH